MTPDEPAPRPLLRVVRGEPTPEDLAALVTALAARAAAPAGAPEPAPPGLWARRATALRQPLHPGPGAWRAAALVPGARTRAAP